MHPGFKFLLPLVCMHSLQACFGVPTLILPNSMLQPPLVQPFLRLLQQHLQAIGTLGLQPRPTLKRISRCASGLQWIER